MRAVVWREPGGPEKLRMKECPIRQPGQGHQLGKIVLPVPA